MFGEYSADLARVRQNMAPTVVCPLCARDFGTDQIELLSVEHAIPSSLGGRIETLTCTSCNNEDGSHLDKHLASAFSAIDGLEGSSSIRASFDRNGHISTNLRLAKGTSGEPITMTIVGKASKASAVNELRSRPPGPGEVISQQLNFGFIPELYLRAAMRAAYLSIFEVERYDYVLSEGAAQVRRALKGEESAGLLIVTAAYPETEPPAHAVVIPGQSTDIGDYYAVLLRAQSERTRFLCVFLPGKQRVEWGRFQEFVENASRLRFETTLANSGSILNVQLNSDPITEIWAIH